MIIDTKTEIIRTCCLRIVDVVTGEDLKGVISVDTSTGLATVLRVEPDSGGFVGEGDVVKTVEHPNKVRVEVH